jgi:hypothetical protein
MLHRMPFTLRVKWARPEGPPLPLRLKPGPGSRTVGVHVGRVLVRASGSFDLVRATRQVAGTSWRCSQRVQQGNGYTCAHGMRAFAPLGESAGPLRSKAGDASGR